MPPDTERRNSRGSLIVDEESSANRNSRGSLIVGQEQTNTELPLEFQDVGPQRIRNALQGLTFATADEMEAAVRALTTGQNYQEAITDIRSKLDRSAEQYPVQSTVSNIAGGIVPATAAYVATRGKTPPPINSQQASQIFPRGMNLLKDTGRLFGIGAAETAAYNYGDKEGTLSERFGLSPDLGFGTTLIDDTLQAGQGGVMALAINAGLKGSFKGLSGLVDIIRAIPKVREISSDVVRNEVRRIASENNVTPDVAAEMLAEGKVLSDIPEIAEELRALYAGGGLGDLDNTLTTRANETRTNALEGIEQGLTPNRVTEGIAAGMDTNTARIARANAEGLRIETRKAYEGITTKTVGQELTDIMYDVLNRSKISVREIRAAFESLGEAPFFRVVDGKIEFTRVPTQLDAEYLRRVLDEEAQRLITKEGASARTGINLLEPLEALRNSIDDGFPEVTTARGVAKHAFDVNDAFREGKKILSLNTRDPDEAALLIQDLIENGDAEVLESFRLGYLASLKSRMNNTTRDSFIAKLGDEEKAEGQLLKLIFPENLYDDAFDRLGLASSASRTRQRVISGSQTAGTTARMQRQGTAIADTATTGQLVGRSAIGDPMAVGQLAQKLVNSVTPSYLSTRQRQRMAELLTTENSDLLQEALTNNTMPRALQVALAKLAGVPTAGLSIELGKQVGQNEEQ